MTPHDPGRALVRRRAQRLGRTLTLWGCQLSLLCHVTLAHAQEPAPPSASDQLIEQAVALLDSGEDAAALLVLQQAALSSPGSARVRVHLAAAHQALGEWVAAEEHLLFALAQSDDAYVVQYRDALDEALRSIQSHLAELAVTGEPAGADVYLDGHRLGALPLEAPIRIVSGAHVLRVSRSGYRSYSGSIESPPGVSINQVVHLAADPRTETRAVIPVAPAPQSPDAPEQATTSHWLTWTLGGLGGAAALTSAVAFTMREVHAGRWNSSRCLEPGQTRAEVCPDELAQAEDWERLMVASGVAAGALLGGALLTWSLTGTAPEDDEAASLTGCGLAWGRVSCSGRF
jgi:PEGA domain-containing protein